MSHNFRIDSEIKTFKGKAPIRFTHNKGPDMPGNHSLHINNYVEIYIFVSGDHRYIVENTVYDLRPGDMIVINPREIHKALPLRSCTYERFYFLIDVDTFEDMVEDPLAPILRKQTGAGNLISFDDAARKKLMENLYRVSDCFRDGNNDELRALGLFMEILGEIKKSLIPSQKSGVPANTPPLLEKILSYINENALTIHTISEISSALGMTPQYLSAYFGKHIGTPLKIYIQAKKIALAKEMLDRGMDVTKVCYDCGFCDCSYFIRIFKKYVGCTPFAYKRRRGALD